MLTAGGQRVSFDGKFGDLVWERCIYLCLDDSEIKNEGNANHHGYRISIFFDKRG